MKTVLVTGSSRGIGLAIAKEFATNGYNVVLNCINNQEKMEHEAQILTAQGANVLCVKADVSKFEDVLRMEATIKKHFGGVDVLVNNAGVSHCGLFTDMSPKDWKFVMDTNTQSVFNCCNVFAPQMIFNKRGSIINISSVWGNMGASCEAVYSASKAAVSGFSKALAKELAPSGIRVNSIACGVINTEMNDFLTQEEKADLCAEIPVGRFGETHEVGALAFFLASEKAKYITGQVIAIDGGFSSC